MPRHICCNGITSAQSAASPAVLWSPTASTGVQASPSDPDNFPFVVLGNKIDMEGGRSRMVRPALRASVCRFPVRIAVVPTTIDDSKLAMTCT